MAARKKTLVRKSNEFSIYGRDFAYVRSTGESVRFLNPHTGKNVTRKAWDNGCHMFVKVGDEFLKLSRQVTNGVHTVIDEYVERIYW